MVVTVGEVAASVMDVTLAFTAKVTLKCFSIPIKQHHYSRNLEMAHHLNIYSDTSLGKNNVVMKSFVEKNICLCCITRLQQGSRYICDLKGV